MLISPTSSLGLTKSEDLNYDPQPFAEQKSVHSQSFSLSRKSTNVSELSKIVTAIKDDHEQDNEELEDYRNRFPEQILVEQLEISSKPAESEKGGDDASEETMEDHPVDGLFAFWQAFLVMLQILSTWGVNAAFGVILDYYLDSNAFPGTSMYAYALMGGAIVFLAQFLAPISVLLVKFFGQTKVFVVGIILQTGGYVIASICKKFWQMLLCEGIMIGLSFTLIYLPGTFNIPTWFDKRKSAAMGIAVSGTGLGGVIFSLSVHKVIQDTGDQKWALRMMGIITFIISSFATVFMRPRNDHRTQKPSLNMENLITNLRSIVDFTEFRQYPFVLLAFWFGIVVMSYVIVQYSFANYATDIGLTSAQASNLLAILNGAQVIGRPAMGQLGDAWGRYNTAGFVCAYVGILIFAFWMVATTYAELIALAILLGLAVGVGSTMTQSLALDSLDLIDRANKLPAVWSIMNISVGLFSLPAEVIALKLKTTGKANNFKNAQIYSGCCLFAGVLIILVNREWSVRQVFRRRLNEATDQLNTNWNTEENVTPDQEKGYVEGVDDSLLQGRIDRYNHLLKNSPSMFFVRMFYPLRV